MTKLLRFRAINPISFTPIPVTIIVLLVYLTIGISVIVVHESVPKAPSSPTPEHGLNTTEAWFDLAFLSNARHPFNTHQNDKVRDWLLLRIEEILRENGVQWSTENSYGSSASTNQREDEFERSKKSINSENEQLERRSSSPAVTIFNDLQSNLSFYSQGSSATPGKHVPTTSLYVEGTNIMVYIRGSEDDEGEWWKSDTAPTHGGVLVNAHFDSVSTGLGATDNGIGVITTLQLIKYFTTAGNQPKKGIVALLNNGEEDYLLGAHIFTTHPLSQFAHAFLNLEGTGPGGRTILLRTTDTEVTKAYATSPHPYGSIVSQDGFKTGVVRSQTDYVVFEGLLGSRGIDMTYWSPRARYHTEQDDLKHTNPDSVWHMLSIAYHTVTALANDTGSAFEGKRNDGAKDKVKNGNGSDAVWFDLFGDAFAVFPLRGLFAWSLTLLIAGPLVLFLLTYLLIRKDKFYYFSVQAPKKEETDEPVWTGGWRGAFSFPIALVFSAGLTVGVAFLLRKVNPLIIYSSKYTVWATSISLGFWALWFVLRGSDFVRPSALQRGYAFIWLFTLGWAALVGVTVLEDRFQIASGYLLVFFETAIFLATIISFLELFALPTKSEYGVATRQALEIANNIQEQIRDPDALIAPENDEIEDEPTESTPLFRGDHNRRASHTTTFANYARRTLGAETDGPTDGSYNEETEKNRAYGDEQIWSRGLPSWVWIIQFLIVAPFLLILFGQVGLFLVQGINQTGPDGSPLIIPHIYVALFSILFILPAAPFAHRITSHIPRFLFVIFIGTLIYNLTIFPFTETNRYKAYFIQSVNLETGQNTVSLAGLEDYLRLIIDTIPSAAGQHISCSSRPAVRSNLAFCNYTGLPPRVVPDDFHAPPGVPPEKSYPSWLTLNTTRNPTQNSATFTLTGRNTRSCVLRFSRPIKSFFVHGSSPSPAPHHDASVPEGGADEIRLGHRQWDQPWVIDVEWFAGDASKGEEEIRGIEGRAVCNWSDENEKGLIPALDELRLYAPPWAAFTKVADGLVEGWKGFIV